jgi:Ser/Thr protein kinase RdoA (MazF antagonist)
VSTSAVTTELAADPRLPHRDTLLDEEVMAERLAAALRVGGGAPIEACRREVARYVLGRRLVVAYRVTAAGREHRVVAKTFAKPEFAARAYADAAAAASSANGRRPVGYDPELSAVMWAYPHDPALPALRASAPLASELLGRPVATELISYLPDRRAVLRCSDDSGAAVGYVKIYDDDRAQRLALGHQEVARRLAGDVELRVPDVLAFSVPHRMLAVEAVSGTPFRRLPFDERVRAAGRLAAALARLHGLTPPAQLEAGSRSAGRLRRLLRPVALLRADASELAEEVRGVLLERWPRAEDPWVCVHGDAHSSNARFDGEQVVLIDLDDLSVAPAAQEFARVLARFRADRISGERTADEARRLEEAFLAGYGEVRELPREDALRWHTAWGLVGRAAKAVTWMDPKAGADLVPLLREAREVLG